MALPSPGKVSGDPLVDLLHDIRERVAESESRRNNADAQSAVDQEKMHYAIVNMSNNVVSIQKEMDKISTSIGSMEQEINNISKKVKDMPAIGRMMTFMAFFGLGVGLIIGVFFGKVYYTIYDGFR